MADNPYESPDSATSAAPKRLEDARFNIALVAIISGGAAAMFLVGFFMPFTFDVPGTDQSMFEMDPLWTLGHLVRGIAMLMLTWRLVQYRRAIRGKAEASATDQEDFVAMHASFWSTVTFVLLAFILCAVVYMAFGANGIAARM